MPDTTRRIEKPQRWQTPYGPPMSAGEVQLVLATRLFADVNPSDFPERLPLAGIVQNDARIVDFENGDIVVRRSDYGSSAFLVLSGTLHIDVGDEAQRIPDSLLGRGVVKKKTFYQALTQLWRNARWPEVRRLQLYSVSSAREVPAADHLHHGLRIRTTQDGAVQASLPNVERYIGVNSGTIRLGSGDVFGEVAALGRTPRTATVFAQGKVKLLEIRWQGLRELRRYSSKIREQIDRLYRTASLEINLREARIFQNLATAAINHVKDKTSFEIYGDFDWHLSFRQLTGKKSSQRLEVEPLIAEQGQYSNGVFLIASGFCRVSRRLGSGELTERYLGPGELFGLEEVAHNWRTGQSRTRQTSLRAIGYAGVLFVPAAVLEEHVLPTLGGWMMPPPLTALREDRFTPDQVEARAGISSATLELLVEERLINGTEAMVIDLNRCTHCDDCVVACAATHDNNPRFVRSGPLFENFMVANACMHCRDPVCLIGCPTGAISRNSIHGEVVINDQTCIGCSTCANNCPYNAIRMVDILDEQGQAVLATDTDAPIRKATKCDLCIDQPAGPACQNACPTDALVRTDMSDIKSLAQWMRR